MESPGAPSSVVPVREEAPQYRASMHDVLRLNQVSAALAEHGALADVVDGALVALSELFAADIAVLLRPGDRAEELDVFAAIGLPEEEDGSAREPFERIDGSFAALAAAGSSPILATSGAANDSPDPRLDRQLRDLDVLHAAFVPVRSAAGDLLAILVLARCHPLPFSGSDAELFASIAYRIGAAIERSAADDERRRLEVRLREAEKAESLGRMAAAVAHNFNNKLTGVIGHLDLALADLADGRDARGDVAEAREAARQAATIGSLMLAYLGLSTHPRQNLDLGAVCRTVLDDLAVGLPSGVRLAVTLPDRPLNVRASVADLRQVLTSLVANAAEAMPNGGNCVVSLSELDAAAIDASAVLTPDWTRGAGSYACLAVSDAGCGMTPATLKNAFDPFFTTKFTGRGLGLPVVLGLARASDGAIAIETEKDRGTTVRVYLPLLAAPDATGLES